MHRQSSCSVETASAAIAFEMFGFLVRDEQFEIFEIAFACLNTE